jgi:hypothetical protein
VDSLLRSPELAALQQADDLSRTHRELDTKIQQTNWEVDVSG